MNLSSRGEACTVNILIIRITKTFVVITLNFELCGSTIMSPNDADGMANSANPLGAV